MNTKSYFMKKIQNFTQIRIWLCNEIYVTQSIYGGRKVFHVRRWFYPDFWKNVCSIIYEESERLRLRDVYKKIGKNSQQQTEKPILKQKLINWRKKERSIIICFVKTICSFFWKSMEIFKEPWNPFIQQ
jgi:hypothetical protein